MSRPQQVSTDPKQILYGTVPALAEDTESGASFSANEPIIRLVRPPTPKEGQCRLASAHGSGITR